MKRIAVGLVLIASIATPVSAQFAVIDPANLAQAILIVQRTQRQFEELQALYRTILRMAQGLGRTDQYRTPPFALNNHDPFRWTHGRPWVSALNAGDPTGVAYLRSVVPLEQPTVPASVSVSGRRSFERRYATAEIGDAVGTTGTHQVGLMRGYYARLQNVVQVLENDVLNPSPSYHEMTAILDKIAAGELLGRRQDMATNQLLSHALEQLLARGKRQRDTDAATLNMQLVTWRDVDAANRAFGAGASHALSTWRQP